MSLNYSIKNCDDWEHIAVAKVERDITATIVFITMNIGMGRITADNVDEFFERAAIIEQVYGPTMRTNPPEGRPEPRRLTHGDVLRRVGLTTNASTMTRAQFDKSIIAEFRRNARAMASNDRNKALIASSL